MKNKIKFLISASFAIILVLSLATFVYAATPGEGYCANAEGKETNIKWQMTEDGTLTFTIDAAATGKISTTVLYNKDPVTKVVGKWNQVLPTFSSAKKVVIGDGITGIAGFIANTTLKTVELPESCVELVGTTFELCTSLTTIYVKGNEPVEGTFDLSNVTKLAKYSLDGCRAVKKIILNPAFTGEINPQVFKGTVSLTEIEIPAGVTVIKNQAFENTTALKEITVFGKETTFESDDVFATNKAFPKIKAYTGSKAEEFAKANGFTFINLETGEETKGTKETTGETTGGSNGGSTSTPTITFTPTSDPVENFTPPANATVWGHSSSNYNGKPIVNTWWVYCSDTKTLEFISATSGYNETGSIKTVDTEYNDWLEYKDEIEHIIVGDYINKVSQKAFQNLTKLKDIRLGANVTQIDPGALEGCTSLNTVWRNTTDRVEGRFDFTGIKKINNIMAGTKFTEVVLPEGFTEINVDLPVTIKTIYAYEINDSLKKYAKDNLYNLINITNPEERYDNYIEVDTSLPSCGGRCVFSFDEATGTLTVHGAGAIGDIVNYHGGGSKTQPWFSIKQKIKHVVIEDNISAIGKYAFAECKNLETVMIPDVNGFEILNAAFEGCENLKSIYRKGTEPIEGTLDLRNVPELPAWTFAYNYLIANVIVSPEVKKIGTTTFEENISLNITNIYGTPGTYAEEYAKENGKQFFDISTNTPSPITCTPPETTSDSSGSGNIDSDIQESDVTEPVTDEYADIEIIIVDDNEKSSSTSVIYIVITAVTLAVVATVLVVKIKKKSAKK